MCTILILIVSNFLFFVFSSLFIFIVRAYFLRNIFIIIIIIIIKPQISNVQCIYTLTGIPPGNKFSANCKNHWIDGRCVVIYFGCIHFSIIVFTSACIMRSNANIGFYLRKGAYVGNTSSKYTYCISILSLFIFLRYSYVFFGEFNQIRLLKIYTM